MYTNSSFNFALNGQINATFATCDEGDALIHGGYFVLTGDPINIKINVLAATPFEFYFDELDFNDAYGVHLEYYLHLGLPTHFLKCVDELNCLNVTLNSEINNTINFNLLFLYFLSLSLDRIHNNNQMTYNSYIRVDLKDKNQLYSTTHRELYHLKLIPLYHH